jgi:DNA-binding NtrC family response regulator
VTARLAVEAPRRAAIGPEALPASIREHAESRPETLVAARLAFDRRFVRAALVRTGGRPGAAADELGLSRQGLTKLIKRLEIARADPCGNRAAQAAAIGDHLDHRVLLVAA